MPRHEPLNDTQIEFKPPSSFVGTTHPIYGDSRRQKAVNLYEVGRFGIRCTLRALLESINDSTHGEVIRAEFDSNSVSREDTDIVHSHLTADVS